MPKLVISLATRGRPQQLMETVRKSVENWTHPETIMVIQADQDDFPTMIAAQTLNTENPRILCTVAPREDTIAAKWNRAIKLDPNADLYLVAADDDPYITPGYDSKLIEAAARFPDRIGMVYGHMANASFSGVVAPTRGLADRLGGIFPEYFPYWFCDHWTDDIARMIGRISFADVRTDQSKAGQTQEMREPAWWATWFDAAYLIRRKIAHDIITSSDFQETEQRRDMLIAHAPLIEARSRWVNDNVRAQFRHWFGSAALDDRYARVKAKAIEMIPQLLEGMPEAPEPGVLGSWGASGYRNALGVPTQVSALPKAGVTYGMAAVG